MAKSQMGVAAAQKGACGAATVADGLGDVERFVVPIYRVPGAPQAL